jgi:ABC-type polysaccharide/polyol phosphate export permease
VNGFHPWVPSIARAAALVALVVIAGLVLGALGVKFGDWLALLGTILLLAVIAPLFWLAVSARRSPSDSADD